MPRQRNHFRHHRANGHSHGHRDGQGDGWTAGEPGARHGRMGGHGHRHGGGRRLGRLFAHGDLRLVILHLINEKPRHGYEIIKAIEAMVAGAYSPSPGTIYPALTLLEEQGHAVTQATDGARKLYAITEDGAAFLAGNRGALEDLLARMDQARAARKREAPAPILEAMERLKLALIRAGGTQPLTESRIADIAAALDDATRTVTAIGETAGETTGTTGDDTPNTRTPA